MKKVDSTGYDPDEKSEAVEDKVIFELRRASFHYTNQIAATLYRNEAAVGLVYCQTEEEFEWLRKRVGGEFKKMEGS